MTALNLRYRRLASSVFRVLHGRGLIGSPDRSTVGIEGSALFVWLALDAELSTDELATAISNEWPELSNVDASDVQDAVDVLLEAGLIEVIAENRPSPTQADPS